MKAIATAALFSIVSLTACAPKQLNPADYAAFDYPPDPVCTNDRQCAAMWVEAITQIPKLSGMKIRMQTDSYIETFDGTRQGRMLGRVVKTPAQDGGYTITSTLDCGPIDCKVLDLRGQALFNQYVTAAGAPFADKAPPEKPTPKR